MQHPFLSDEWMAAVDNIRAEYHGRVEVPASPLRINLIATEVPFRDDGQLDAHVDTRGGHVVIGHGHLEDGDVTVTVDYQTAKELFVGQDPEAIMTAFMSGKILVQGDITALMALMAQPPDADGIELANEIAERTREVTAP